MSALNNADNLNTGQSLEFHAGKTFQRPPVGLSARLILPTYAQSHLLVTQAENLRLTASVSISQIHGTAAYGTAAGAQAFDELNAIELAQWDTGQIHIMNISVQQPLTGVNVIIGHPSFQLVDGNGTTYPSGMLIPGRAHKGLRIQANLSVYTPDGTAPTSVIINATGLLVGSAGKH